MATEAKKRTRRSATVVKAAKRKPAGKTSGKKKVAAKKPAAKKKVAAKRVAAAKKAAARPARGAARAAGVKPRARKGGAAAAAGRARPAPRAERPASLRGPALAAGRSGAPEIMVTLNNEHRYIASLLEALAEQADNLLPNRAPDYTMIYDIVHYMANFPDEFHHPREDLVFDKLVERDPESREPVDELLEGHREINRRSKELLEELTQVVKNSRTPDNQKLKYLCDRYIGYYWDHINTEESRVFPRATAKLRSEDWFDVNTAAKYVDDPLFGTRVQKEYRRLSQYLEDRVQRATEDFAIAELFGIEALIETVATVSSAVGEFRGIFRSRIRQSFSETMDESSGRLKGRDMGEIVGLPRAVGSAFCRQLSAGRDDLRELGQRLKSDLSEPFSARVDYLKKLLREDWG